MSLEPEKNAEAKDNPPIMDRPVVLVGLMGAGKSCVGRRLAESFGLPFIDSDGEVETAAGCDIRDIFEVYGEPAFRDCERRVIQRLLEAGPSIIATGGGAFIDPDTRAAIKKLAVSLWLRADTEVLYQRTRRSNARPLLNTDDPLETLNRLAEQRYPIYAEADITIDTGNEGLEKTLQKTILALKRNAGQGSLE
ncbi:MAG: shikimate kinase [Rhodospirillales bacterium]